MVSAMKVGAALSLGCLAAVTLLVDQSGLLSLRGRRLSDAADVDASTEPEEQPSSATVAEEELLAADLAAWLVNETTLPEDDGADGDADANSSLGVVQLLQRGGGWHQGGDKLWGGGTGVESINSRNIGYYNRGMYAARSRCGGSSCALIVNPAGHRSIQHFHIHFVHYAAYGAHLKHRLEKRVCGHGGWRGGGLPCHGKAAFFSGFPAVFSKARTGGGMRHASVIAWPGACGGRGTIVQLAYGCSIEHQIRGDFDARYR